MSLCKGAPPFLFGSPWLSVSRSGPVKLHAHDCGHCSQFRTKERASLSADVQRAGRLRTGEKQASEGHPRFSDLFGCLLALGQALRVGTAMGSGLQVASPQPLPGPHLCSLPSGFPPTGFGWQGHLQGARRLRGGGEEVLARGSLPGGPPGLACPGQDLAAPLRGPWPYCELPPPLTSSGLKPGGRTFAVPRPLSTPCKNTLRLHSLRVTWFQRFERVLSFLLGP